MDRPSAPAPMSRVVLIDDHPLVLAGLASLLDSSRDFEHTGSFVDAALAVRHVRQVHPDVVVCDVRLSGTESGPEVCRRIALETPTARVVMLTAFMDARLLQACLDEGAAGIMLKTSEELDLLSALRRVRAGEVVIDPAIAERLAASPFSTDDGVLASAIRPSEHKVLRLLAAGLSTREIEHELDLANSTVRGYAQVLMEKLDAHSRVELVVKARRMRLV